MADGVADGAPPPDIVEMLEVYRQVRGLSIILERYLIRHGYLPKPGRPLTPPPREE